MNIAMFTSELAPVAKAGGLGDAVAGLAKALVARGHTVDVLVPLYDCSRLAFIKDLTICYERLYVPEFDRWTPEIVYQGTVEGLTCFFFPCGDRFRRKEIYAYDDDIFRFAHFCRAGMEFLLKTGRRPDILHANDWSTALAPILLYEMYAGQGFEKTRAAFTIHNIEHQGQTWSGEFLFPSVGLDAMRMFSWDRLLDDHRAFAVNLMKGAIVYSNAVNTVSPTYAREIMTPDGGKGLDGILRQYHTKVRGIINGIDFETWNPATDPLIPVNYSADTFDRKFANKRILREKLGIKDDYRPIVACITRLVHQKGLDLIKHAIFHTLRIGGQFALLGTSPMESINQEFRDIGAGLYHDPHSYIGVTYNEELAHLMYAGADIIIVPSIFEPCGLTQIIGLRYGTVPLVRRTGGLADTVFDHDFDPRPHHERNGFVFDTIDAPGIEHALNRAVGCWFNGSQHFNALAANGMRTDNSWERSAAEYEAMYNAIKA